MAITHIAPPADIVYDYRSKITIEFTDTLAGTVGLVLTNLKTNQTIPVELTQNDKDYKAVLSLPKGRYEYYFTNSANTNNNNPTKYKFSVGYVFVIVGHSLAESNGEKWCNDNRVKIIGGYQAKQDSDWKNEAKYVGQTYQTPASIWATKVNLPAEQQYPYTVGIWSRMAELIAQRDDVDIAFVNTGMGGSSVEMWADIAMQRPFLHGFASPDPDVPTYNLYNSGFPYIHFQNVLKHIVNKTGVTAVLVQHGENDMGKDPKVLARFYKEFIEKARAESGMMGLPVVIAKSAWLLDEDTTQKSIDDTLASVDEALKIINYSHVGPDTHLIPQSLRGQPNNPEDEHFNPDGAKEVARMWADLLTETFIERINNGISTITPEKGIDDEEPILGNGTGTGVTTFSFGISNYITAASIAVGAFLIFLGLKLFKFKFIRKVGTGLLIVLGLLSGAVYLTYDYFVKSKKPVT